MKKDKALTLVFAFKFYIFHFTFSSGIKKPGFYPGGKCTKRTTTENLKFE